MTILGTFESDVYRNAPEYHFKPILILGALPALKVLGVKSLRFAWNIINLEIALIDVCEAAGHVESAVAAAAHCTVLLIASLSHRAAHEQCCCQCRPGLITNLTEIFQVTECELNVYLNNVARGKPELM